MNNWIKFGLLNASVGLLIGLHITVFSIGDDYYMFSIAAPIAAFITGGLFWKWIVKNELDTFKIIITGILTGTVSHYFTFVLLNIGTNICYWTTGNCADSLSGPPANIFDMLLAAFLLCVFSLAMYGWISVPVSILCGFIIKRIKTKK